MWRRAGWMAACSSSKAVQVFPERGIETVRRMGHKRESSLKQQEFIKMAVRLDKDKRTASTAEDVLEQAAAPPSLQPPAVGKEMAWTFIGCFAGIGVRYECGVGFSVHGCLQRGACSGVAR
jgi:hypothetical protein